MKTYKRFLAALLAALFVFAMVPSAAAVPFGAEPEPKTHNGTVARGDVDGDGALRAADARLALRLAVGLETYPQYSRNFVACDADGDGAVNAADARLILRASVGLEILSFSDNFYMPLVFADTPDFTVAVVRYFHDEMLQGFDLDVTNKRSAGTLEIDVGNPSFNGFMPDGSYFGVTLKPGETETASLFFEKDLVNEDWIASGWIHELRLQIDAYDLSVGNENYHPAIFSGICGAYPNKAFPTADVTSGYPYEEGSLFYDDGERSVTFLGVNWWTDGEGEEADLLRGLSLEFYVDNYSDRPAYFYFDNIMLCGESLGDAGGKYLFPAANGHTYIYVDPAPAHAYLADLDSIGFTMHVWDSENETELYFDDYWVDIGKG